MNDQVLFVDDEPILLDTMRRLMVHDFKVTTAAVVRTKTGTLLATKGHQVTSALLECLRNFADGVGVVQSFRVLAVAKDASRRAA